jgi:hypothetical protein
MEAARTVLSCARRFGDERDCAHPGKAARTRSHVSDLLRYMRSTKAPREGSEPEPLLSGKWQCTNVLVH